MSKEDSGHEKPIQQPQLLLDALVLAIDGDGDYEEFGVIRFADRD